MWDTGSRCCGRIFRPTNIGLMRIHRLFWCNCNYWVRNVGKELGWRVRVTGVSAPIESPHTSACKLMLHPTPLGRNSSDKLGPTIWTPHFGELCGSRGSKWYQSNYRPIIPGLYIFLASPLAPFIHNTKRDRRDRQTGICDWNKPPTKRYLR